MGSPPTSPFNALEALKSCWLMQESRVRRMLSKERITGKVSLNLGREVQILVQIINETHTMERDEQLAPIAVGALTPSSEGKPLSPLAEKVNQQSEVDRNLLGDWGDKFITLLKKQVLGDNNDTEDLEIKLEAKKSETPDRD
jgi:hypothetical protein